LFLIFRRLCLSPQESTHVN